jgi:hypothetical protein
MNLLLHFSISHLLWNAFYLTFSVFQIYFFYLLLISYSSMQYGQDGYNIYFITHSPSVMEAMSVTKAFIMMVVFSTLQTFYTQLADIFLN